MAILVFSDDELDRLAERIAGLVRQRLSAPAATPTGWLDAKRAATYAGCSVHSLRKAVSADAVYCSRDDAGDVAQSRRRNVEQAAGARSRTRGYASEEVA